MASLLELKKALDEEGEWLLARKVLVLGKPKSGKTVLAATVAKSPSIKNVYFFDMENGIESVLTHGALSDSELDKITYIPIKDTHEYPLAAETLLKCFTAMPTKPVNLCTKHGKVGCPKADCANDRIKFSLASLGVDSAVIVDSGSQLASSILSLEMKTETYKDLRKYYGAFTIEMDAILSGIQAAECTVIMVTHIIDIMSKPDDPKTTPKLLEHAPLFGSQNYSRNKGGKYFGWTLLCEQRNGKYLVGSSPKFRTKCELGNRAGVQIEDYPEFDMSWIFKPVKSWPEPKAGSTGPAIKLGKS